MKSLLHSTNEKLAEATHEDLDAASGGGPRPFQKLDPGYCYVANGDGTVRVEFDGLY